MKPSLFTAVYAILVGTLMILMWSYFIAVNQVPEYNTRPAEITMHLIDEFLTAMLLIVSGIFALRKTKWGNLLLLPSIGMLLYTMIVSPGYYLQSGKYIFVFMFAGLLIHAVFSLIIQIRKMLELMKKEEKG